MLLYLKPDLFIQSTGLEIHFYVPLSQLNGHTNRANLHWYTLLRKHWMWSGVSYYTG